MAGKEKRIGLIVGREWSFPPAFIKEVNGRNEGVTAELVQLGGTKMDDLVRLRGAHRPHLARGAVLSIVPQVRGAAGRER